MAEAGSSPCAITTLPAKTTTGILRAAMKLPAKNEKLMLQVFFLLLFPFSLLVLLHYHVAGPLIQKIEDAYETSSLDPKDVRALVGIEIPFFLSFLVVSLFGISVTIYSSALTYTGKSTTLKELALWIGSTWKKPAITWIHIFLQTIVYVFLSLGSVRLTVLIGAGGASYLCGWIVGILAASLYLYLACVWILALVISIVENDCSRAKAIEKARRLVHQGRRIQGFFLMLILSAVSFPIYVLLYVTTTDDDDEIGGLTRFAFIFIATVLFCLANSFTFMVFTVFHFECKQNHGEKSVETEFGPGYLLVPTVNHPDA